MNYALMPSLKHIAFVKIGITLLNQYHIQELLAKRPFIISWIVLCTVNVQSSDKAKEDLKKVEDAVFQIVLRLPLPISLKRQLQGFVEALCWQLLKWRECIKHLGLASSFKENISKFYWTSLGTIDKKKSVELYIKDESLDINKRYQLACEYCLEDYVIILWKRVNVGEFDKKIAHHSPIMLFWSYYVQRKLHYLSGKIAKYCKDYNITPRNITPYEYMFRVSIEEGKEIATAYFFQKLTAAEIEKVQFGANLARLYCISDTESYADIVCFLFSSMNDEQKNELLEDCPYDLLRHFLIWPRQRSFMEVAKSLPQISQSSYKPDIMYYNLLKKIASRIINHSKDYNYQKLFVEFWNEGPTTHKKYVIDNYASDPLLSTLFKVDDKQNIQFILKDKSVSEKRKNPFL